MARGRLTPTKVLDVCERSASSCTSSNGEKVLDPSASGSLLSALLWQTTSPTDSCAIGLRTPPLDFLICHHFLVLLRAKVTVMFRTMQCLLYLGRGARGLLHVGGRELTR